MIQPDNLEFTDPSLLREGQEVKLIGYLWSKFFEDLKKANLFYNLNDKFILKTENSRLAVFKENRFVGSVTDLGIDISGYEVLAIKKPISDLLKSLEYLEIY